MPGDGTRADHDMWMPCDGGSQISRPARAGGAVDAVGPERMLLPILITRGAPRQQAMLVDEVVPGGRRSSVHLAAGLP